MEYKFLLTYLLVLIALLYSYKNGLGVEREMFINSLRAFVQLLLLGFTLLYVFEIEGVVWLFILLLFMVSFAAFTAGQRVRLKSGRFLTAFTTIFLSSAFVLVSLFLMGVLTLKPNELIPISGMVIGNALTYYTLTLDRFKTEVKSTIDIVENMTALGVNLREALAMQTNKTIKGALIPISNTMQTVGIIHIPGIMSGMLIAGAEPIKAVSYQLVILYMLVSVSLLTSFFTVNLTYKKIIAESRPTNINIRKQ